MAEQAMVKEVKAEKKAFMAKPYSRDEQIKKDEEELEMSFRPPPTRRLLLISSSSKPLRKPSISYAVIRKVGPEKAVGPFMGTATSILTTSLEPLGSPILIPAPAEAWSPESEPKGTSPAHIDPRSTNPVIPMSISPSPGDPR